jgi:hypothetical protein
VSLVIQGVYCHENGCPNTHKEYNAESGEWVRPEPELEDWHIAEIQWDADAGNHD